MEGNRTSAAARSPGGKAEDGLGRAAEDNIDTARQMPDGLDDTVRRYIETKPYTTALIALGLGWIMGRSHRPF